MAAQKAHVRGQLSARGNEASGKMALPYLGDFFSQLGNVWNGETNPDGYCLMAVAENHQNYQALLDKLATNKDKRMDTSGYTFMRGTQRFREALAAFLQRSLAPEVTLDPFKLCVSSGCGALLDNLAFALCEPGDAVLVPSPMYGAFASDVNLKSGAVVVPCPTDTQVRVEAGGAGVGPRIIPSVVTDACLQAGWEAAVAAGHPPKVLILCNPGNPSGTVMAAEEVLGAVAWARGKGLHTIIDEVYANGCFYAGAPPPLPPHHTAFRSALTLFNKAGAPHLGSDVHLMWGFSKDFAVSGYRVGMVYSDNEALQGALDSTGYFCAVSNHTQEALAEVLEDEQWTQQYLRDCAAKVQTAYAAVAAVLGPAGVPVLPPDGGLYAWVDLRSFLLQVAPEPAPSTAAPSTSFKHGTHDSAGVPWAAETELGSTLFREHKVLLTPGRACSAAHAGFFRICLTWMDLPGTVEGAKRIVTCVHSRRGGQGGAPRSAHAAPHGGAAWQAAGEAKL